jgi:hypothetical protein
MFIAIVIAFIGGALLGGFGGYEYGAKVAAAASAVKKAL